MDTLIHYSTSSAFCKNSVKSILTKRLLKLGISVERRLLFLHHSFPYTDERDCTIRIDHIREANRKCGPENIEKVTMNFNEKPVLASVESPKKLVVYWEKEIDGLIFMLDYLTKLFPYMPICYLEDQGYSQEVKKKQLSNG